MLVYDCTITGLGLGLIVVLSTLYIKARAVGCELECRIKHHKTTLTLSRR